MLTTLWLKGNKMARKTREQLLAERKDAEEKKDAADAAAYFPRLMAAMELATNNFGYELRVSNSAFVLYDSVEREEVDPLPSEFKRDALYTLNRLEHELAYRARLRAEEEARELAKKAALAKLTDEERRLLGV